jgi:hypothetical protein
MSSDNDKTPWWAWWTSENGTTVATLVGLLIGTAAVDAALWVMFR